MKRSGKQYRAKCLLTECVDANKEFSLDVDKQSYQMMRINDSKTFIPCHGLPRGQLNPMQLIAHQNRKSKSQKTCGLRLRQFHR